MTNIEKFGDNEVRRNLNLEGASEFTFSAGNHYTYRALKLKADESQKISGFGALTIYCFRSEGAVSVSASPGSALELKMGDVAQAERETVTIKAAAPCLILFAGTAQSGSPQAALKLIPADKVKKVMKPWGFELWLSGEHPCYAFKHIEIKKGTRTSLQYHRLKQETNVLMQGEAKLHYRANTNVALDAVTAADVSTVDLKGVSSIDVMPLTLHRLEAMSDIVLCEVSTPHLDDVVRLSDDSGRTHGRIDSEHVRK